MDKRLVSIVVSMLLIVTVPAVTANVTIEKNYKLTPQPLAIIYQEDFDSYATGSSMHGQGGWKGWDNDPAWTAYTSDNFSRSTPNSVDIQGDADLVREFVGIDSGLVNLSAWCYVPTDFIGQSYFILLNDYEDNMGQDNHWSVQVRLDADQNVVEYEHDGIQLPLIKGEWVEFLVKIDLTTDWHEVYYDGELLHEKEWTAGPNNDYLGVLALDAIDLFANLASSVYWDDIEIEGPGGGPLIPDLDVQGDLSWTEVPAGSTQTTQLQVSNVGQTDSELNWEVESFPSWGDWTFTPDSGTGLTPAGSPTTVDVTVVVPNKKDAEFSGTVKFVNTDNTGDFVELAVSISTPRAYQSPFFNLLQRLINRFPLLKQILQ